MAPDPPLSKRALRQQKRATIKEARSKRPPLDPSIFQQAGQSSTKQGQGVERVEPPIGDDEDPSPRRFTREEKGKGRPEELSEDKKTEQAVAKATDEASKLHRDAIQYLLQVPHGLQNLKLLLNPPFPVMTPISTTPLADEYAERVEIVTPLVLGLQKRFPYWRFLNCHLAIVLAMPLHKLRRLNSAQLYSTLQVVPPVVRIFLIKDLQSKPTSSAATNKSLGRSSTQKNASDKDPEYQDPSVKRRQESVRKVSMARDGYRCVVTGHATTESCHIIPFAWTADPKTFAIASERIFSANNHLPHILEPAALQEIQVSEQLVPCLGHLDKSWNIVILNRILHKMWGEAKWTFKYIGHVASSQPKHVDVSVQFEWLGTSCVSPKDEVDMTKLTDPDVRVLLDDLDSNMENSAVYDVRGHRVRTGLVIDITMPEDEVDDFIYAIQLQYAMLRIASLCAAGLRPEDLPDLDDDDDATASSDIADVVSKVSAWAADIPEEFEENAIEELQKAGDESQRNIGAGSVHPASLPGNLPYRSPRPPRSPFARAQFPAYPSAPSAGHPTSPTTRGPTSPFAGHPPSPFTGHPTSPFTGEEVLSNITNRPLPGSSPGKKTKTQTQAATPSTMTRTTTSAASTAQVQGSDRRRTTKKENEPPS